MAARIMSKLALTLTLSIACAELMLQGDAARSAATPADESAVSIEKLVVTAVEPEDVERVARGLRRPWSLAFTPDGELLITEKYFGVRVLRDGRLQPSVLSGGPPNVFAAEDSGVLDIALDPDFAETLWVYIAFVEGDAQANRTAVWKTRYDGARLSGGRVIFRSRPDKAASKHPGGRLLFLPDKTFLLTVGDGYDYKAAAQDLASDLGKTLRLTSDGDAPPDNPFIRRRGALPEIWTYGHRNAQGLARDRQTGDIWLNEHGPRGGDEVNLLRAGANYGWPLVTHGIDYDGSVISERALAPGIQASAFYWAPSIAPSGLAVYRGDAFPDWRGKLFVGGLASKSISRLRGAKDAGRLVEEARMLLGYGKRIRDVREGPDGFLYILTDDEDGELLRLRPRS